MFAEAGTLKFGQYRIGDVVTVANISAAVILYTISKVFYRLYLSPLSTIPGPKLAVATHLYAFYHDVVRQGLYIWEIEDMHKQYGPIVRISPDEIHVNDPEFIDQLYGGPGKRRNKGQRTINGLSASPTVLGSQNHDLHKSRRAAVSPFFSKQNIRRLDPTIDNVLARIFDQLDAHIKTKQPINMSMLYRAATRDIISEYAFGDDGTCPIREDLNEPYFQAYHEMVINWHIGCYFPWIGHLLRKIPPWAVAMIMPTARHAINSVEVKFLSIYLQIDKIRSTPEYADEAQTIFHGLLHSDLPESEKTSPRLAEEAQNLLAAGTDSTANTLAALTYELLTSPEKLQKLRTELQQAIPDGSLPVFSKIESLPYLSAVIQEGLRLHPAVATRQERIAPDEDLSYTDKKTKKTYRIPAGTCMAMSAVLLSRLPEVYPSPEEFRPERFLEDPKLKRHQLTFSRGSRICMGINLAYQEMYMILAALFRKFDAWDGTGEQKGFTIELFKTTREDVTVARDLVTENMKANSVGVRAVVRGPIY
ncbi:cytochrome P450 [Xylogone sp. PMI_703]|nr:cytochrome P450 [Xylogone sp. PMI_703]